MKPINGNSGNDNAGILLGEVKKRLGMTPNMFRVMANAPAALEGYLRLEQALESGVLPLKLLARIALVVAETTGNNYCLALHTAHCRAAGLDEQEIEDSRRAECPDKKVDAALKFARNLVLRTGGLGNGELVPLRAAGYSDEEIIEIVSGAALNLMNSMLCGVGDPDLDFPAVYPLNSRS